MTGPHDRPRCKWSDPPLVSIVCRICGEKAAVWLGEDHVCPTCEKRAAQEAPPSAHDDKK